MTKLEAVLTTLKHKEGEIVPNQTVFLDSNSQNKFVPTFKTLDWREELIKQFEYLDNSIVNVTKSGFMTKTIEETSEYTIIEFENGAGWRIHKNPYWREYLHYPIEKPEDLDKIYIPDPNDPATIRPGFTRNYQRDNVFKPDLKETDRYAGIKEDVKYFKEKGYFTSAEINGFFSGVWYFFRRFNDFLIDMVLNEKFAQRLVDLVGEFNLKDAQNLLNTGVHSLSFPDDLGYNTGLFFSPSLFRKYFFPWIKKLAALCHDYGAYLEMHSHGNINEIMPLIVEAGVDILNPVGPSDRMNLKELKERYGKKITFFGGLTKYLAEMTKDELERHLREVIATGRPGGGFMLRSEGGVPYTMSREKFEFFLETIKRYTRVDSPL